MSGGRAAAAPGPEKAPGIGIDLIEVDRLESAMERRPGIAKRVFRPAELEYARSKARPARHLAARFAAKEAAVKALGAGPLDLRDFEVVAGAPPALSLHGRAAEAARGLGLSLRVSLTHSRDLAAAVVRADPRAGGPLR